MEVNDCHLQFFDSLGNLIYEFDLETIIALNNGNGILIKDELTTLTIDKTIVVNNLTMTIAELITYIQEQRVLCTCACGDTPTAYVTSATWGYDNLGVLFYVKQKSDGSVVYESPIGTITAPTGDVGVVNVTAGGSSFNIIEATGSGNIPNCIEWNIENTGGAAGTIEAVNFINGKESKGQKSFFYNQTGTYHLTDIIDYDASGTTFLITYTTI